jgi:hypothetical protein
MLFTAVLCLSGIGVAAAEPQKNQIVVEAACPPPNGPIYIFVINGMSKTGHVTSSTDADVSENANVVVKQFIVKYFQKNVKGRLVLVDSDEYGNNKVLNGDLIQCRGTTNAVLQGLGPVTAIYDFQAFVTPRGKA